MKKKSAKIAVLATIVAVLLTLVVWAMISCKRHAQAEGAFAVARELAFFANAHGHLPSSIQEFCQWEHELGGHYVWDPELIGKKISFLWLSPDFSASSNSHFLAILDPSMKEYEVFLNEQIIGRIPTNILLESSVPADPNSLRR